MGRQSKLTLKKLDIAAVQIDGKRDYQEDAYKIITNEVNPTHMICLLADGMGGHAAGDVAANLAINSFEEALSSKEPPCHEQFMQCLDQSNRALREAVSQNSEYSGMGCTIVALEIYKNTCHWISVGDSPLFHIRSNKIKRINADHSMAAQLDAAAKMGEITEEEARKSPSRNILLSALTGDKISRMDYARTPLYLEQGDWLILASDGVETLTNEELLTILKANADASAKEVLKYIMAQIIKRDKAGQDNATAIVIYVNDQVDYQHTIEDQITTRPIMR